MQICPDCHATVDDEAIFCDQCGFQLRPKPGMNMPGPLTSAQESPPASAPEKMARAVPSGDAACPICGYLNLAGEIYCVNCGVQLAPPTADHTPAVSVSPAVQAAQAVEPEPAIKTRVCPNCAAENPIQEEYCRNCGLWLNTPVQTAASTSETSGVNKSLGWLVSPSTNERLNLPHMTELIIGRRDPEKDIYPDVDLSNQGAASSSVSRQHARLVAQGSQVFIEDLNSMNATFLNRQRLQPGQRYLLNHGDELQFGGVPLIYYAR